ncbi:MAG: metal-dependent transcriptional regulator [Acidimicrobiales bacterium]|nr:metal-dependent transcriptional regulator [Acidimicrobiales bacterium]
MDSAVNPAFAHYCQTIFELDEDEINVIQARIAERLGVSRPAVSEMIRRLEVEGLVAVTGGRIALTVQGAALASQVVRRHRLAERFLTDVLHISWAEAHAEAERWSGVISDRVEEAMVEFLGEPTTCPHGNPIPGSAYNPAGMQELASIPVGGRFTVARIPEELEFTPGLLEFLERSQVIPGSAGQVVAASPDGTVTVEIDGTVVGLGSFASERILVEVAVESAPRATTRAGRSKKPVSA